MSNLLNCPFCNSGDVKTANTCGAIYVTCKSCESYGPMVRGTGGVKERIKAAEEKWNVRESHLASSNLHANSCSCHVVAKVSDTTNHLPLGSPAP